MQSDTGINTSTEIFEQVLNQFPGSRFRNVTSAEGLLTGGAKPPSVIAIQVDTVEISLNILNTYEEIGEESEKTLSAMQKWVLHRDHARQFHRVIWAKLDEDQPWTKYYVSGASANGYPVKLIGEGWELLTGKIAVIGGKPNTRIQIHSELLWLYGYETVACGIIEALKKKGLVIDQVRLSRVDLMTDILVERGKVSEEWGKRVNGAAKVVRSFWSEFDGEYTGFETASGPVKLRVYDKFDEIRQNSKKDFSYVFKQWGIGEEPEKQKVIRVEYELRRAFLRSWGINEPCDLLGKEAALWGYLTEEWARVTGGDYQAGRRKREVIDGVWGVVQGAYGDRGKLARLKRERISGKAVYLSGDAGLRLILRGLQVHIGQDKFMRGSKECGEIDTVKEFWRAIHDLMIYCGGNKDLREELVKGANECFEECLKKGYMR